MYVRVTYRGREDKRNEKDGVSAELQKRGLALVEIAGIEGRRQGASACSASSERAECFGAHEVYGTTRGLSTDCSAYPGTGDNPCG